MAELNHPPFIDLKPVMQQSLKFNLKAADGTAFAQEIQHTIHAIP